jgi:hypothetical protein
MGWLFTCGSSLRDQIAENTKGWERITDEGVTVTSTCLAHCYRGGRFSGVLWSVWERTFQRNGQSTEPRQRWIGCDLLRYQSNYGWGYKDMEESMHPYYYSCPMKYLDMVPLDQFRGHVEWREGVKSYHARAKERRQQRRAFSRASDPRL